MLTVFRDVWSVEKISLADGYGKTLTWCKEHGELLPKNVPVNIGLQHGECSSAPAVISGDKGPVVSPSIPSGLTAPAPPVKPLNNGRPGLLTNDISKHSDILENNIPTHPDNVAHSNVVPRPVLLPVKPQLTVLPVKQSPAPVIKPMDPAWNMKQGFNPRPPLQPFHLQGPPGAWNIITSKPGSLPPPIHVYQSKLTPQLPPSNNPNNEGIEIQLGPRLPLPPLHPVHKTAAFPARRRPSTKIKEAPAVPPPHVSDMSTADSETVVINSSTEKHLLATERVDEIPEQDIIVIETNQLKNNNTLDTEASAQAGNDTGVKTDITNDDQLTIFKVGPDNDIVRINATGDNETSEEANDYKFVILHKLPNGNAVNLENLKTYNYEDLIKGHSSVIEDANENEENFDRENLEFFDVPRRVTNDPKDPYIIYQLPDDQSDSVTVGDQPVHPVYTPNTVHQPVQDTKHDTAATSNMTLTTNNTNEWIPRNKSDDQPAELTVNKLSELSQLAQISINNNGPIKIQASTAVIPPKLNVQLLPPRLSAVLSHLDSTYKERDRNLIERDRFSSGRAVLSSHRQNKISPAFQPPQPVKTRSNQYARRINTGEMMVTKLYQTQVIPNTNHRYIPLLHNHQEKPLWWQPQDKQYQLPIRPHQLLAPPHHFNLVSRNQASPSSSTSERSSVKENLTLALDKTKPPLVFNEKQSVLLGRMRPLYMRNISSVNESDANQTISLSIVHNDKRSEQNSTTLSSDQHLSTSISPTVKNLQNKSDKPTHHHPTTDLLKNKPPSDSNTHQIVTKPPDINEELPHTVTKPPDTNKELLHIITKPPDTNEDLHIVNKPPDTNEELVKRKELSANNESSDTAPVSGQ